MEETILTFKIGNYANFLDDKEIQFDENYDMRGINIFESFKYKGIELTTDWLLAFGFKEGIDRETEHELHSFYNDAKSKNEVSVSKIASFYEKFRNAAFYQKDTFLIAYIHNEDKTFFSFAYYKIGLKGVIDGLIECEPQYEYKYVHELQNLYHSKTKKQLIRKS